VWPTARKAERLRGWKDQKGGGIDKAIKRIIDRGRMIQRDEIIMNERR